MRWNEKKMKKEPKVSIIIPVYNGSNYVKEAIDSAIAQTYKNIEIIVVNDGSTDDSSEIIKSYGDKVKYFYKENGGVSTALNLGISKMTGEYFSWLSHDDRYYPNKIETQIQYLKDNNLLDKNVITYSNYDVINEKSEVVNATHFEVYHPNMKPEHALLRGLVSGTALLIPKKAFDVYGVFDEQYRCIQDYLLFFRFMKTYKYIHIPAITNSTRVHSKQVTNVNPKVISENNFLWTLMMKETPAEVQIRLEGSQYKFYKAMYEFLTGHNKYTEAHKFALDKIQEYLNIEEEKILKILEANRPNKVLKIFSQCYSNIYFNTGISEQDEVKEMEEIINTIGINKVLNYIVKYEKKREPKIIKSYNNLQNGDTTYFARLKKSIKNDGLIITLIKLKTKVKNKLKSYSIIRKSHKAVRIILKIILFIPKKILLFIINS